MPERTITASAFRTMCLRLIESARRARMGAKDRHIRSFDAAIPVW